MRHGSKLHIIHVAGTRRIAQGTDGVPQGCLAQGIMAEDPMASFIPLTSNCFGELVCGAGALEVPEYLLSDYFFFRRNGFF
jgi:hypothetical protein